MTTTTRVLVPTLAALAAIPTAQAFDVAGDGWELSIEPRIQSHIEFGATSDANGDDTDPWNGGTTDNPRDVNFFMRRARLYFKGKSDTGWGFSLAIDADHLGESREDDPSSSAFLDDRSDDSVDQRRGDPPSIGEY